jgi:hypothetical protein
MFDYDKAKEELSKPAQGFQVARSEGRFAQLKKIQEEFDADAKQSQKEFFQLKDEMQQFRKTQHEGEKDDSGEVYMECFPTYGEDDDFQISVKDNLRKRPPGGEVVRGGAGRGRGGDRGGDRGARGKQQPRGRGGRDQ